MSALREWSDVPGPRSPAVAQTLRWSADAHRFLDGCGRRYGDAFRVKLLVPGETLFLADPATVKRLFTAGPEQINSGEASIVMKPVVGANSLIVTDGLQHLRQRRLMLPAFHGERMRGYKDAMVEETERDIESWRGGQELALLPRVERMTFEIIVRTVFGIEDSSRLGRFRDDFLRMIELTAAKPLFSLLMWTTPNWGRYSRTFRRMKRQLDGVIVGIVRERRGHADLEERSDVLSMLLLARDEHGQPMTDDELRDQLITLLLAGYEATATSLAWLFERLLREPEQLARAEAAALAGDEGYIDAVVKEALRVRTPIPQTFRMVAKELDVDGVRLEPGRLVAACVYLLHRRPEIYPEPDRFDARRYIDGNADDTYAWIPFGGGVRRCIGATYAALEMRCVVMTLLRRVRMSAVDPTPERPKRVGVIFQPHRGCLIRVEEIRPRTESAARGLIRVTR
jgi:cytochrome P450